MRGIVMRPMYDWIFAGIVDHLAADLDPVSGLHRDLRGQIDIVDHVDGTGCGLRSKLFVMRVRARSDEKRGTAGDRRSEIDHAHSSCVSYAWITPSAGNV